MLEIVLKQETLQLLPERAIFWPAQQALIVADLHWGKSAHFRKHGIAIPAQTQVKDEIKLAGLIQRYAVERLIIAGDLFHSKQNKEVEQFLHWRSTLSHVHIDLVIGNHDKLPAELYSSFNLQVHNDGLHLAPFYISHDVPEHCTEFCIHGHIHPAVRISGKGRNHVKVDCYAEDTDRFILPAFGQFTGNYVLDPEAHKHIYLVTDNEVIRWK